MSGREKTLDALRAWLSGTSVAELPEGSEDLIRDECGAMVGGLVKAMDDAARRLHKQGEAYLDRVGGTDFMRGYYLGLGRGIQISTTTVGHVLNWAVRRGLK